MRSRLEVREGVKGGFVAASFTGQWYHFAHVAEAFRRVPIARNAQVSHIVIDSHD
jgi:hypothetical protein